MICKFGIAAQGKASGTCRIICYRKSPHFVGFTQRNIVAGFRADPVITGGHPGIAHTVITFTFIIVKVFAHRLPGGRPVILRLVITDVKISAGLVKAVENVTQNPSVCA